MIPLPVRAATIALPLMLTACAAPFGAPAAAPHAVVRANAFTSSTQEHVALDQAPDHSYVLAWDSRRQQDGQYAVYARHVSAEGRPLSPEIQVNLYADNAQMRPAVACAPDGAAWIAWQSYNQDGQGWGVVARRLDPDLSRGSTEIGVNLTRAGHQSEPVIAINDAGNVLIAWMDESPDRTRARARLFDPQGRALTDERTIADTGAIRQSTLTADTLADGAFVLAWTEVDQSNHSRIAARILDDDAAPRSAVFTLVEGETDNIEPSLAAGADTFALSWLAAAPDGYAVRAQAFDTSGRPLAGAATIAQADADTAHTAATIAHIDGARWLVAFNAGEDILGSTTDLAAATATTPAPLTDVTDKAQQLAFASGTRQLLAAPNAYALAFNGNADLGDSSGAHLLIARKGLHASRWSPDAETASLATPAADPHLPPTFDPDATPGQRSPLLGGDGPDFGFEGVPFNGWTPPDCEMSVGQDNIVLITNGNISFFNKSGALLFTDQIEGAGGFWGSVGAGGFVFDPETVYDPFNDRYWAMACERTGGQSYFLLAVSDDADAVGTWHKYRINVTPLPGIADDIDSANFAVSQDHVYLTADFFTPGDRFLVYIVPKTPLLDGDPAPTGTNLVNLNTQSFGVPQHFDDSAPRQYLIESTEFNINSVVRLHAVNDPDTTPSLSTFTLDVPDYRYPGNPTQQGTGVSPFLFEPRFWSCQYVNGSLWAVHHIRRVDTSNTIVRWYQIAMNGWPASGSDPTLTQWGEIDPGPTTHAYFPSISANADGDAAITCSRSSSSEFISVWRATHRHTDPAGTFNPLVLVKQSTAPSTSGRWGDYSQTRFDPAQPCTFWGHNEWTSNPSAWSTWVAQYVNTHPADINHDCTLSILDFIAFQNLFQAGDPAADIDGDGQLTILDFIAFQQAFQS